MAVKQPVNNTNPFAEIDSEIQSLCFSIFKKGKEGQRLMELWVERHLMQGVAFPGQDSNYAFFYEGSCEFIRNIRRGCAIEATEAGKPKAGKVKRKSR